MSKPSPGIARLQKEYKDLVANPPSGSKVSLINEDLFKWELVLEGPESTPYEKGVFDLEIELPVEYPFKAPKVSHFHSNRIFY